MKQAFGFTRLGIMGAIAAALMIVGAAPAWAESSTWICVPETTGATVTSGGSEGKCEAKTTAVELPPAAEMTTLNSILPHMQYIASGIGGKPTIKFSGVNVQIINGEGKTATVNGDGNLVIGYDEGVREQTGSHNLILGTSQKYTSYGGILAGELNAVTAPFASVVGGLENIASTSRASVSGGYRNTASGTFGASISGGREGIASGPSSSVSGGGSNVAEGNGTWVGGGGENAAGNEYSSISGGSKNSTKNRFTSVSGGNKNIAEGKWSSIFGSKELTATKEYEALP